MILIQEKDKIELDKLIKIAKKYRDGTLNISIFRDVVYSLSKDEKLINEYRKYMENENVILINGDDEIEDVYDLYEDVEIKPYDTNKIDISPKPLSLDMILARLENDEIDLMPDFQRKSGLWDEAKKSQLIESLILRIPLPAFYFDGSNNDKWVVIDGLQRLTALKEFFMSDKKLAEEGIERMKLSGMEFLTDLNGASIDDMPRSYVRRMKETQIITYIINPGAPINLKYNIFKRINTGGLELEQQEIRHALFQGYATIILKELACLELFKEATGYSIKTDRMLDREFVLRFISFYELGENQYKGSIDSFLNCGMEYINLNYTDEHYLELKKVFKYSLMTVYQLFGKFAFRRMPDKEKRRPISKALFETWITVLARLSQRTHYELLQNKEKINEKYMDMCLNNREFAEAVKSGKTSSVKKRFELIENLIKESI